MKKRLVEDRQQATRLVLQQVGGLANLQNPNLMCYDEFNKVFCKGMFKVALINTLDSLQDDMSCATPGNGEGETTFNENMAGEQLDAAAAADAKKNFSVEMPLSLKIERYQRNKLLSGLNPQGNEAHC